jgi:hypothetical protein
MSNDGLRHRRGRLKASIYIAVFGVGDEGDRGGEREDEDGSAAASGDRSSNR